MGFLKGGRISSENRGLKLLRFLQVLAACLLAQLANASPQWTFYHQPMVYHTSPVVYQQPATFYTYQNFKSARKQPLSWPVSKKPILILSGFDLLSHRLCGHPEGDYLQQGHSIRVWLWRPSVLHWILWRKAQILWTWIPLDGHQQRRSS